MVGNREALSPDLGTATRMLPSRIGGLLITLVALAAPCFLSMAIGTRNTSLSTVWAAITAFDPANTDHR